MRGSEQASEADRMTASNERSASDNFSFGRNGTWPVVGPADRFDAKPEHEFEKGLLPEPPEVSSNLRDFYVDWRR